MVGNILRVRYELTNLVRENAVFKTFAAFDKVQSREVSIRVLNAPFRENQELLESLQDAIRRLSSVRQANIEELTELDSDDQATFIVGALTKGSSIAERLKKLATFSVPATVEVGIAVCEGLQALHRAGFAHGDLGGRTVAMQADGEVRLQDSGLWLGLFSDPKAKEALISSNSAYTAPEISKGTLPTPTSDVYSAGVLLFELVTGRLPYHGETSLAMALQHATEPIPSPKVANPSVPQALDHIIRKALSKQPGDRYANGGEMLSDLRMLQDALRFGKSLTWPLRSEPVAEPAAVVPNSKTAVAAPKPEPSRRLRPEPSEDDTALPIWLRFVLIFILGAVAVVGVMFIFNTLVKPPSVKVPKLSNMSYDQASAALQDLHLKLIKGRTVTNEAVPAGMVISTSPEAGRQVLEGDYVTAVVSAGSKFVEVPDLRGMTMDQAKTALANVGLQLNPIAKQVPDRQLAQGLILSQDQRAGGKYQRGTTINVVTSSGRRIASNSDQSDNSRYTYNINIAVPKNLPHPVTLRADITDSQGTRNVVPDTTCNPGDTVPATAESYGSWAELRIFYDGQLVEQKALDPNKLSQTSDDTSSQ